MSVKKRIVIIAIIVAIVSLAIFLSAPRNIRAKKALSSVENRIDLYLSAYITFSECMQKAGMFTEFDSVELVHESMEMHLDHESAELLAGKIGELFSYPVSISYGHDRYDAPADSKTTFINLHGLFDNSFSNLVMVDGNIIGSVYYTDMYFKYKNNAWILTRAEITDMSDTSAPTVVYQYVP
jgi:hypothetical protein